MGGGELQPARPAGVRLLLAPQQLRRVFQGDRTITTPRPQGGRGPLQRGGGGAAQPCCYYGTGTCRIIMAGKHRQGPFPHKQWTHSGACPCRPAREDTLPLQLEVQCCPRLQDHTREWGWGGVSQNEGQNGDVSLQGFSAESLGKCCIQLQEKPQNCRSQKLGLPPCSSRGREWAKAERALAAGEALRPRPTPEAS